jgi:hypothetical protein
MICIFCGSKIGAAFPIPIEEIRFTPIVPNVPGIPGQEHIRLGTTILTDRLCCQECYMKIQKNDFEAIREAGKMPDAH